MTFSTAFDFLNKVSMLKINLCCHTPLVYGTLVVEAKGVNTNRNFADFSRKSVASP